MMIRGDQHVDDWAEVAVDYLDGQLDQDTRVAVESHLAGCPECAARLRKQQSVVRFLQETPLYDPPEDLEYRAIGEIVFPSPGGQSLLRPVEVEKPSRTPNWYRTFRAWIPATVAVVALLAAVVGYGIVRSGSGPETVADSSRAAGDLTTMAASATTAAPEATMAAAGATTTTAGAMSAEATSTTALVAGPPTTEAAPVTVAATQDRKTMIRALETAQAPAYVSFRAPVTAPPSDDQSTSTSTAGGTDTTVSGTPTTGDGATETTAGAATDSITLPTVSQEQAASIVQQITGFTGLLPVDKSLWLDGPTFAAFLPREDAEELVDLVRSIGASLGLVVRMEGNPPATGKSPSEHLLEHKKSFAVLAAHRALQPATWGYDFTTSTLAAESGEPSGTPMPDEAGTHVIVVIWIAQ
jgi:anti-sigma factor RsiW